MLSSFFSNNLTLNKASLEVFNVSGRRWLEFHFLALGAVGPLGGALFLRCPGVWIVGDCGSGASGFGFTSFGAFR